MGNEKWSCQTPGSVYGDDHDDAVSGLYRDDFDDDECETIGPDGGCSMGREHAIDYFATMPCAGATCWYGFEDKLDCEKFYQIPEIKHHIVLTLLCLSGSLCAVCMCAHIWECQYEDGDKGCFVLACCILKYCCCCCWKSYCSTEPIEEENAVEDFSEGSVELGSFKGAAAQRMVSVTVPPGVFPGQQLLVNVPGGRQMFPIIVPPYAIAGSILNFSVPEDAQGTSNNQNGTTTPAVATAPAGATTATTRVGVDGTTI